MTEVDYFPKLRAPFKRDGTLVIDEVRDGYEWVFDEASRVKAVEKIDGENMSVTFNEDLEPVAIHRRDGIDGDPDPDGRAYNMGEVPLWNEEESHYTEGIANAFGKGWMEFIDEPGQHFGELVGPKVQGNRYDLDKHYWVPFAYARENLVMESYGEHGVSYDDLENWFTEIGLLPLFYHKMHGGMSFDKASERHDVEGVVFTHPEPETIDSLPMAKLRVDMF